ncbi:MAG: bacteriorhodopsin [Candidatus Kariarchaeum pelagius]
MDLLVTLTYYLFFVGYISMGAAFVFFWTERGNVKDKLPMTLSGLIVLIAAVHYYYMRGEFVDLMEASSFDRFVAITPIRYIDWILTTPLMVFKFVYVLKADRAWGLKLMLLDFLMVLTGLFGELTMLEEGFTTMNGGRIIWGTLSGIFYFWLVYELWNRRPEGVELGPVMTFQKVEGDEATKAYVTLLRFVLIGWGIYPIGYLIPTYFATTGAVFDWVNIIYNIGDFVNKIGFGFATYLLVKGSE